MAKNKIKINKKGFSLIEVLATLAILALSLATISKMMASNIKSTREARNELVAMGLAQESVELVHNLKANYLTFKSVDPVKTDGEYVIDKDTTYAGFGGGDTRLYLTPGGFYVHNSSGNTATKFYRSVTIYNNATDKQIEVVSHVSWNDTGSFSPCTVANKCVSLTSVMPDAQ